MIQRTKIDLSEERRILSYMITSTPFLSQLQTIAKPELFQSSFSRTIAEWIWEFYGHTEEAPARDIEQIYLKKKKEITDEDDQEMIREFLSKLSSDWEKNQVQNVNYTVKNAVEFFKLRSLEKLKDKIEDAVNNNDSSFGERIVGEYKKVEKPVGRGVDILKDKQAIVHAFSHENEFLFSYPGALGNAIGPFMRGDFYAIMGAMKKGKTHYLWYTAHRALLMGLKVLFVSMEMTEQQMIRRMWHSFAAKPIKEGMIIKPYFKEGKAGLFEVDHKKEVMKALNFSVSEVERKQQIYKMHIRTGELRLVTYPRFSVDLQNIETELFNLEYYEGFIPDVIIYDYADIVKPVSDRMEYRHQLDSIWKTMAGQATARSALVVTGSQTGRQGLYKDSKAQDIAEDVRKLAHVTKMVSLNQNDREKEDGIMRIKSIAQREGKQYMGQVVVLQCYDIGRPYMDSRNKKEVNMKKYEDEKK